MGGGSRKEEWAAVSAQLKLDFDDPRTQAAMRVMGIILDDLVLQPLTDGAGQSPREREKAMRRHETFDRKRNALAREIKTTAEALDESYVVAILDPAQALLETSAPTDDLNGTLAKEREKIEKQRMWMHKQLQRSLGIEVEKKERVTTPPQAATAKTLGGTARNLTEMVEREDEMRRKQAEKEAKKADAFERALSVERDRRAKHAKSIKDTKEKVERFYTQKEEERRDAFEDRRKKMADIADRNMKHEQFLDEKQFSRYATILQKERELAERHSQRKEDKEQQHEESKAKYTNKQDVVKGELTKQEQERREAFEKAKQRHLKAHQERLQRTEEKVIVPLREKRERDAARLEQVQLKNTEERKEWLKKVKENLKRVNLASAAASLERGRDDSNGKQADMNEVFSEVVQRNRDRIERSDNWGREQTLQRIQQNNGRIDRILEERRRIIEFRLEAQKDLMIGRTKLNELKRGALGDTMSANQVNKILKELDLPPLTERSEKHGEEGDDKK